MRERRENELRPVKKADMQNRPIYAAEKAVACPMCHAEAGERCRSWNPGYVSHDMHPQRAVAWVKAGRR